jgi:hypothetical protein
MHDFVPIHNWPTFFLSSAAGLALWAPLAWFTAIDDAERDRLRGLIRKVLPGSNAAITSAGG